MDEQRLRRQFDFCREIDKEKFIRRQTLKTDAQTHENDAEHAWHASLMAILLSEYANEEIDILKTVTMLLIHDLVEIYAGDTYAYDDKGRLSQRERELAAADKLFAMLPDDQCGRFRALWEEFEACETAEALFAHTMDNIQPMMLNAATDGVMWQRRGVTIGQIEKRNEKTAAGSLDLWEYARKSFLEPNLASGRIKPES